MSEAEQNPVTPASSEPAAAKKIQLNSKTRRGLALMRMLLMAASDPNMPPYQTLVDRLKKRNEDELNQALAWVEQNEDWESVEKCWEMMKEKKS
jgi:hypothetical protein